MNKNIIVCCFLLILQFGSCTREKAELVSHFESEGDRQWIGEQFWANPLMDWQIRNNRLVCIHGGRNHNVRLLTHEIQDRNGNVRTSIRTGFINHAEDGNGFVGFRIGIKGNTPDYRSTIFLNEGTKLGVSSDGYLFIGDSVGDVALPANMLTDIFLELEITDKNDNVELTLICSDPKRKQESVYSFTVSLPDEQVNGHVALACEGTGKDNKAPRGWFDDWYINGDKLNIKEDQTFGPIFWTQYTLSEDHLTMLAFLAPFNTNSLEIVTLELFRNGKWGKAQEAAVDTLTYSVLFNVENWDATEDVRYRVIYPYIKNGSEKKAEWHGTIRKEPKDKEEISLAAMTGLGNFGFPHHPLVKSIEQHDPDLLFFSGDQIYEGNDGFGTVIAENEREVRRAMFNYLSKWWTFGWTYRELMKNRPSIMTVDDHDLYQNDIWGKGGVKMGENRCMGGYLQPTTWVNAVEYSQMGHLPEPVDSRPIKNGIHVHFTRMKYGGLDLAVIEDRKFKSAPGDVLDHPIGHSNMYNLESIKSSDFDPEDLDDEELILLGDRQLSFLKDWVNDRQEVQFKAVVSGSPFCMPHHGYGGMVADLDANGWPQSARDNALRVISEGPAVMIHGDIHLATLVQHGIDEFGDGPWSFSVAAAAAVSRRIWAPENPGINREPGAPEYTGDFFDGLGNRMTVVAVANPDTEFEKNYRQDDGSVLDTRNLRGSGFGIIRFNRKSGEVTFESWPIYRESVPLSKREQHPGWPETIPVFNTSRQ